MENICRLCLSKNFVNNSIFDEENALYLKMSLYLPIKVIRNDRLPQKICDKCSCKVNDFYQFCNETIEVQNKLQQYLSNSGISNVGVVDLTRVKGNNSPLPGKNLREQYTQTEDASQSIVTENEPPIPNDNVAIKQETSQIKEELVFHDYLDDSFSDTSDSTSLMTLKKYKIKKKSETNGVVKKPNKTSKLNKLDQFETLLSEDNALDLESIKQEVEEPSQIKENIEDLDVKNVQSLKSYICCICMMQFYCINEIKLHYRTHASEGQTSEEPPAAPPVPDTNPLRCLRCRKLLSKSEWSAHWVRHWERDRRPYRCALCEKSFRDLQRLIKHGLSHQSSSADTQKKKLYLCDNCPESFVYLRYLQAHRTVAHPEAAARPLQLRCGICGRQFTHIHSLRRHLASHDRSREHLCNICGKALTSKEHLRLHLMIHSGYKPHACKICGKAFVKKCNLTLHERVHTGEKPHVCSSCGKAFSQRSTLTIHERYHTGARPYTCPHCNRGFVAKGLLSMHLKTTCI